MISPLAKKDAQKLQEMGKNLSLEECVRLNALGLKVERPGRTKKTFVLPRVVILGDLILREPTVGQQLWLDEFSRITEAETNLSELLTSAFAYSTSVEDLPSPYDVKECLKGINEIAEKIKKISLRTLASALLYVAEGCDHTQGEYAPPPKGEEPITIDEDEDISIALGILLDGSILSLGITLKEAKEMTRLQLETLREEALINHLKEQKLSDAQIQKAMKANRHKEYLRYFEELRKK